jgi:hypothetical protein
LRTALIAEVHRDALLSEGTFTISIPSSRSATKNKKRLAKGKVPLIEFKIAKITGKRNSYRPFVLSGTHASPGSLGRGHWTNYKYNLVKNWIAPMEVGDEANGRIIKTYAIG